jgi:hypothetical protein
LTLRKLSPLGVLAFANFATAGLGQSMFGEEGKLSISNLAPVMFILIAAPCYLAEVKTVSRQIVTIFLFFNVCALASFVLFMFRFGWMPNAPVLGFQDVEFIFALLLVWYARHNYEEFFAVAKAGMCCCALLAVWYGITQFQKPEKGLKILTFGMDDKSQAAVLFCCLSYILLRFYDGWIARGFAAGLLAMSMMTLSRLPAVFLPVLLLTLSVRTRYGWMLASAAVVGVAAALIAYGDTLTTVFAALDRLSSVQQVAGDNATSAHLLLIRAALEMKFDDLLTFFFGSGPGNFSKALTSFPIDIHELQGLDPALVADAQVGRAPMHSTPISLLLDYNILVFGMLVYLGLKALRHLFITGHRLDLLFFVTLLSASLFYSLHNKPYFFLAITTVAIGVMGPVGAGEAEEAAAARAAHGPLMAP